jgi:hypothetical protein
MIERSRFLLRIAPWMRTAAVVIARTRRRE